MKEFRASIAIRSTPEKIWSILTDAPAYPSWNTTVSQIEGNIALGEKIAVRAKISPDRAFPVKVTVFEPPTRMVWLGGAPLKFIFKGVRTFTLTPKGDGAIEFAMHEVFSGLFSSMIAKSIPDLKPSFDEFAECLKRRAEG